MTAPEEGLGDPPTLTVAPFRSAMLASWVQSPIEMPVLVHWLMKPWPLLVGVGEAATLDLVVVLGALVGEALTVEVFQPAVVVGQPTVVG